MDESQEVPDRRARVRGCLLGGAVGDALGAPVEFLGLDEILALVGPGGVRDFLPPRGQVTDDTQMTLFVAEGLVRARAHGPWDAGAAVVATHEAMLRWLDTQDGAGPADGGGAGLVAEAWLHARRAPGTTCLSALRASTHDRLGRRAANHSKGCGGVMRSAPFGLLVDVGPDEAYDLACASAGCTHGHPSGRHAAGALALVVARVVAGEPLLDAVDAATTRLRREPEADEVLAAVEHAVALAASSPGDRRALARLGEGWVAEEALAISLYAALSRPGRDEVLDALALAVTHSGDSDSTGAVTGNILGACHGLDALPPSLAAEVEGRSTILRLADELSVA